MTKIVVCAVAQQASPGKLSALIQKYFKDSARSNFNESKVNTGKAFILYLLALVGGKKSKYDKRTVFSSSPQRLDLSFNSDRHVKPPKDLHICFPGLF